MAKRVFLFTVLWIFVVTFAVSTDSSKAFDNELSGMNLSKIVGGKDVNDPTKYPWMGFLTLKQDGDDSYIDQFCGATLIAPKWVLTAAHCVMNEEVAVQTENFDVVFGTLSLESQPEDYERIGVRRIFVHPDYNKIIEVDNDIALIELERASEQTPIDNLSKMPVYPSGTMAKVIGWGFMEEDGESSVQLQEVDLPLVSNIQCADQNDDDITENMICAGFLDQEKAACSGDSGGPLFIQNDNSHTLVGIVSFGYGCPYPETYGVYTRVSVYTDTLQRMAQEECLFDTFEEQLPQYFTKINPEDLSQTVFDNTIHYRAYPLSGSFIATYGGQLLYYGVLSEHTWIDLGPTSQWFEDTGCTVQF